MGIFRDWLEAAVPQTVDLTNGGKRDSGVSYWGAVPKTGTLEPGTPQKKKSRKKKKKEIQVYPYTWFAWEGEVPPSLKEFFEAAAVSATSPLQRVIGALQQQAAPGVSQGLVAKAVLAAIDENLPNYFPESVFKALWRDWQKKRAVFKARPAQTNVNMVLQALVDTIKDVSKSGTDLVRFAASPGGSSPASEEDIRRKAQAIVQSLKTGGEGWEEAQEELKRARQYISGATKRLVDDVTRAVTQPERPVSIKGTSIYQRETMRNAFSRSPSMKSILNILFGAKGAIIPRGGKSRREAQREIADLLKDFSITEEDDAEARKRKVLEAKEAIWAYLQENSETFRNAKASGDSAIIDALDPRNPPENAPPGVLSRYASDLEAILAAPSVTESTNFRTWLENSVPEIWKPLAVRRIGQVGKGEKKIPLFWNYFDGEYIVGQPKKDKGALTYYSPEEITVKDKFGTLEDMSQKYDVKRLGFVHGAQFI